MGQVTIYLENGLEAKMTKAAQAMRLSKSKWVSQLIQERVTQEWPSSIIELAGAWQDLPTAQELRSQLGRDVAREKL